MDKEREERSSMTDDEKKRLIEIAACDRTHDPIIVDGTASYNLSFDGPHASFYNLTNAENPTRYSGGGLIIKRVTVIVGETPHNCTGVPSSGRCTVLIQGERSGKHKAVKVTGKVGASGDVVEVEFDKVEYPEQVTGTLSKKFGRKDSKVKSVTIIDDDTGNVYKCTGIPSDGKCAVVVCDDHAPHKRPPKDSASAE